jgi:intracellular sulfur oxidation DsrE/DsrF family protein
MEKYMNKFIAMLMTAAFLAAASLSHAEVSTASAQTVKSHPVKYEGQSTKFAVMVGDVMHFKAAILTADQLLAAGQKFTIEVVIVGELAKAIAEDRSLLEDINKAEKLGVKLMVCEVALAHFKVSKDKLDKRIGTVRNGWIRMFELKDKGYNTLNS